MAIGFTIVLIAVCFSVLFSILFIFAEMNVIIFLLLVPAFFVMINRMKEKSAAYIEAKKEGRAK